VYRNTTPPARPVVQPPAPRIVQNIVRQTVVHYHQTTHQHIQNLLSAVRSGPGETTILIKQTVLQPAAGGSEIDESRPALTARRMLRVLSADSARQILRPFYRELFQGLLAQERENYQGRPARSLLLVRSILGQRQTLTALQRFYRQTMEQLDIRVLRSLIFENGTRRLRQDGEWNLVHRYARREADVPEDLRRLPAARRFQILPLPPPERETVREPEKAPGTAPPSGGFRLSGRDFRILVRGVADALDRQRRTESLRRGGM